MTTFFLMIYYIWNKEKEANDTAQTFDSKLYFLNFDKTLA